MGSFRERFLCPVTGGAVGLASGRSCRSSKTFNLWLKVLVAPGGESHALPRVTFAGSRKPAELELCERLGFLCG